MKKDLLKTGTFALAVSAVLLFAVLELKKFQTEEDTKEMENKVIQIESDKIKYIYYGDYKFERSSKKLVWQVVSPYTDYLNYPGLEKWAVKALTLEGRPLSDPGEDVNWSDFDFKENSRKLAFETADNQKTEVLLSNKEAFDGSSYLKVIKNGEAFLYSSSKDWREIFSKDPESLRSFNLFNWEVPDPSSLVEKARFFRDGKEYLSLKLEEDTWTSSEFRDWSFDKAKVDAYLSDLKNFVRKDFVSKKVNESDKVSSILIQTDSGEGHSLSFFKQGKDFYVRSSYRAEHLMKTDSEAIKALFPEALELRDYSDLLKNYSVDGVKELIVKILDQPKKYILKDSIWTLGQNEKTPNGYEFNGALIFQFLEKMNKLTYKRYISDKNLPFKSAKKRLYFYIGNEKDELRFAVGQDYPCSKGDEKFKNCVLVATNKVKNAYAVVLKSEMDILFKTSFFQKERANRVKNKEQKKPDKAEEALGE